MSYLDDYRTKINLSKSSTSPDFMLNEMKKQFKDYLQITPTRRIIKKDTIEYVADIQDVSQVNKNNNDEKYCITEFGLDIQIGDTIYINDFEMKNWLVTEKENMTIEDRQRYKIRPCNNILKFYNKLSNLIQVPVISENKTLWTLGVSETNSSPLITGDAKLNILMSDNELTKDLKRDIRLICDGMPWKITIKSSNRGLSTLVCGETQQMQGDDMVNEIPVNPYPVQQPLTQLKTLSNSPYTISGSDTIKKTVTSTYIATNSDDTNAQFDFHIDYGNVLQSSIAVTIIDSNTIKIKNLTDSGEITLIATDKSNNQKVDKLILLKGLYDK